MVEPRKPDAEQLIARAEIHDAMMRYLRGIDRREWSLVRSAFHEDALQANPYDGNQPLVTVDELIDLIDATHEQTPRSLHFLGNVIYEFVTEEKAVVESYLVTYQIHTDDEGNEEFFQIGSRYIDLFERRAGEWKVAKRLIPLVFTRPPVPGQDLPMTISPLTSVRGPSDPLWEFRAAQGLS